MSESNTQTKYGAAAFLRDAFVDYIGARVLLLANLPEQGAILCSTAIEKCAKAVIAFRGDEPAKRHLNAAHWQVLQTEPNFGNLLNGEFVELCRTAYQLRYSQDLPLEYHLVVASREFVAEMDRTVLSILSCFGYHVNGARRFTGYEAAIARDDQRLTAENRMLTRQPVGDFVCLQPQAVYEVRRDPRRGFMEARYLSERCAKRPGFLRPGLARCENGLDYELSHFPVRDSLSLAIDGIERVGREGSLADSQDRSMGGDVATRH